MELGAGRLQVLAQLGGGSAGTVYRAYDRQLQREVAVKTLRSATGRDLLRFKREFRALAELAHPNLVALHDLYADGETWYFTMELVRGVSFLDWVRPSRAAGTSGSASATAVTKVAHAARASRPPPLPSGPPGPSAPHGPPTSGVSASRTRAEIAAAACDEGRLRQTLIQLCDALVALHKCDKLHRDVKPSNVLVTPQGRAVLVDFGLVSAVAETNAERLAVGTPVYMSPEQAADVPLAPASDWYSVGVMVYEAITGRRPFEGAADEVMRQKQTEFPVMPSTLGPVPAGFEALTMALLHPQPQKRPSGVRILTALGAAPSGPTREIARARKPSLFVGRGTELDIVRRVVADARRRGNALFVRAASGMGKSSLIRHALAPLRDSVFVLEGRCYERESVPFKLLDGVVDALAGVLAERPESEQRALVPRDVSALLRLFPVLRRVAPFVEAAQQQAPPVDPQELRRCGFTCLRQLLSRLAKLRPVVIVLDDAHWGDLDSAAFASDLIHSPDAGLTIIVGHRPEDYLGIVNALRRPPGGRDRGADIRELELGPMPEAEARALIAQLAGDERRAATIVPAAGGNPFLLAELALVDDEAALGIDALVGKRAARLDADAQALLIVSALAGRPLPLDIVAAAAGLATPAKGAAQLAAERLASLRRVEGTLVLAPAHDYVRTAVVAALSPDVKAAWHEALARAFEAAPTHLDSLAIVEHWLSAGHPAQAATHAVNAAVAAEEALAFRRAAELYQVAQSYGAWTPSQQRDLFRRQAAALTAAGQLDEAAAAYGYSAQLISDAEAIDLERLRVEQLLRRGRVEEALPGAERVLAAVGVKLPLTSGRAIPTLAAQWLSQRLRGYDYVERALADVPLVDLRKCDVLYSLASGMGFCDPMLGRMVQSAFLRTALSVGEPYRVGLALSQEAVYVAAGGQRAWPAVAHLAERLQRLANAVANPQLNGIIACSLGLAAHLCGQWQTSLRYLETGQATLRNFGSNVRWEIDLSEVYLLTSQYYLGQWREFARAVPRALRDAVERGDLIAQFWLRVGRTNLAWLMANKLDDARAALEQAGNMLGDNYATLHHVHALLAQLNYEMYVGEITAGRARLEAAWPTLTRMQALRVANMRIELLSIRGRLALAGSITEEALRQAESCASALQKEEAAFGQGLGSMLAGAIFDLTGRPEEALHALAASEAAFETAQMAGHLLLARLRRAQVQGGAVGRAQAAAAMDQLQELGVVAPIRFANALAPLPSRDVTG